MTVYMLSIQSLSGYYYTSTLLELSVLHYLVYSACLITLLGIYILLRPYPYVPLLLSLKFLYLLVILWLVFPIVPVLFCGNAVSVLLKTIQKTKLNNSQYQYKLVKVGAKPTFSYLV